MTSQQRFTTSEVAADWHEPMVSQRIMWPSTARANEQLNLRLDLAGPTVWNSLPDSLRDPAVGPDQFRRDLKTHLFE